jgi:hypothetical protein
MRKNLLAFYLIITFLVPSAALAQKSVKITPQERKIAEAITAAQLSDYLHFVASDEMEGRDTPSRGLDITAKFIATMLSRWGFKPAGDEGTFFQKMYIRRESVDREKSFIEIGGRKFKYGQDFYRFPGPTADLSNKPIVFATHGWVIKSKNINAFEGLDVKDKIVALYGEGQPGQNLIPLPDGVTNADLTGERGTDWNDGIGYALQNGAAGVIILPSKFFRDRWAQIGQFFGRGGMYVEKLHNGPRGGGMNLPLPGFIVSSETAESIFAGEAVNPLREKVDKGFELKNQTFSANVVISAERLPTQNVVAVWEGSDPSLKNEYVAVGAHYDHVGVNPNVSGNDKIFNGADDDGSGTVAVLAIAEALAKAPVRPKRSILLVWHAGEEKGLWGSAYFNKFPTVNIKNVVTQLNIDMIGRSRKPDDTNPRNRDLSGENEIYVIGSEMMSSTLGAITKQTNEVYLKLNYNYRYDAPNDPNRFFFRSDHFYYAQNGIPIVFWFDGEHQDYHGVGDHADKIDYVKMEKVARTVFMTMWKIAELKDRPKVDKKLPPELTRGAASPAVQGREG